MGVELQQQRNASNSATVRVRVRVKVRAGHLNRVILEAARRSVPALAVNNRREARPEP